MSSNYENILNILTREVEIDGKKYLLLDEYDKFFNKGNKKAGARIRKFMQLVRREAELARINVQKFKKDL